MVRFLFGLAYLLSLLNTSAGTKRGPGPRNLAFHSLCYDHNFRDRVVRKCEQEMAAAEAGCGLFSAQAKVQ